MATTPTLEEIKQWPATVDPATGGAAFGISRSYAYELVKRGEFPAKTIQVGGKTRVITASILAALDPVEQRDDVRRLDERAGRGSRSRPASDRKPDARGDGNAA